MKNTVAIFCICLLFTALQTNAQVNEDSNKLVKPITPVYHSKTDSGYHVTTIPTYDYPPAKTECVHAEPLSLGVTYFTEFGNGGCLAYYQEFNTTYKTVYDRDDFKRFGIRNFPNIWH
jgi:hypothetical protein